MKRRPIPILLLVLALVAACGGVNREQALNHALVGVQAARAAFMDLDKAHQEAIVEHATSLEQGKAELAKYRETTQARIMSLFALAYVAISVAAMKGDDVSLTKVVETLAALRAEVDKLVTGGGS